jgi:hypothetical protein
MNARLIRVLLVVIGVAVLGAAGYFLKDLDTRIRIEHASADSLRDQAKALTGTIADVRAGQVAYVARGQGEEFWMTHVASLLPALRAQAAGFSASLTSQPAHEEFQSASASIENFLTLDSRVKEFVTSGNSLLAADLIFSDGLESTSKASAQVALALNEELEARGRTLADMQSRQLAILGGAAASILLLMLGLAFADAAAQRSPEPQVAAPPVEPVRFEAPLPRAKPAITPKLVSTARLCSELARVSESEQLPGLLARTAKVLDATGLIVWLADSAGRELHPAMSHGYPPQIVAKMGVIQRDTNNAAAAAYRAAELRTATGDNGTSGAVVAPLMTSDGCIGVLSAEMKGGSEKDESSQALAAIFAAQLATLVSPPVSAAPAQAAAQG